VSTTWHRYRRDSHFHPILQLTPVDLALQQQATGEGVEVAQVGSLCFPLFSSSLFFSSLLSFLS
jgi:hypothetical protein